VRLAANHAIDRRRLISETLGLASDREHGSALVRVHPRATGLRVRPREAKQLLTEARWPSGFDGGDLYLPALLVSRETLVNYLGAVGIG
jgi:hypothetical protein